MFPATVDDALGELANDFNFLADGIGQDGTTLADGWSCIVVNIRGDWEFFSDVLRLPRWNVNGTMCFKCRATGVGPSSLRDMRTDAPWVPTKFNHAQWLGWAGRGPVSVFNQLIGASK